MYTPLKSLVTVVCMLDRKCLANHTCSCTYHDVTTDSVFVMSTIYTPANTRSTKVLTSNTVVVHNISQTTVPYISHFLYTQYCVQLSHLVRLNRCRPFISHRHYFEIAETEPRIL